MMSYVKFIIIPIALFFSCNKNSNNPGVGNNNGGGANGVNNSADWLIPKNEVVDGGPGKDGIPALENPESKDINSIGYLSDNDIVIGFQSEGVARAYPLKILDWHEIINDNIGGKDVAIVYCPLTGTGIAWSRLLDGVTTTFGVSGLLYNANLLPYDRITGSNWSQMRLDCVNGKLKGTVIETYHVVETSWKTWKEMFPNSTVVTTNTGFSRDYNRYPYGDYKTNNPKLIFPVSNADTRLPGKERVLAVIENKKAKVYQFGSFENGTRIIIDTFQDKDIVVVGNKGKNFIAAFEKKIKDIDREFSVIADGENIMQDVQGNKYNLFGTITEGPDKGESLVCVTSFMGFWFSFGSFYPNAQIY